VVDKSAKQGVHPPRKQGNVPSQKSTKNVLLTWLPFTPKQVEYRKLKFILQEKLDSEYGTGITPIMFGEFLEAVKLDHSIVDRTKGPSAELVDIYLRHSESKKIKEDEWNYSFRVQPETKAVSSVDVLSLWKGATSGTSATGGGSASPAGP